jgi:hypothetical protein
VEKVVFKYCQDVKSTGVEGADFQKKFKRGLNDCKDIAGVTILVNSFAGLIKALKYCDDSDANGGMEVVSLKNTFMYDEDSDEGFRTAEGHNPGDLKPLGDSEKVYHPGEEMPAGEKLERRFKKPFVMLKDGRYFQLYEKEDGGNGRCKKTDPECRGREIVLPYHGKRLAHRDSKARTHTRTLHASTLHAACCGVPFTAVCTRMAIWRCSVVYN